MNRATAHSRLRQLASAVLACAALAVSVGAEAAPQEANVALADQRFELSRLAPGQTHAEVSLVVDDATLIAIDAVSTASGLTTSIIGPGGQTLDEATIASFGGEFTAFEAQGLDSSSTTLAAQPGFHSLYRFPSLGPGIYRLLLDAPAIGVEAAVVTSISTDSAVGAALIAPDPQVVHGSPLVLSALIFAGSQPVTGASVTVDVRDPQGVYTTVVLADDGAGADDAAGDGLYSAQLTPSSLGIHGATAEIAGTAPGGAAFVRQAATQFEIVPPTSALLGPFDDSGLDDDGDGFLDRVELRPTVDTVLAGPYRAIATLQTTGGATIVRSGDATLAAGSGVIAIDFDAAGLLALGEDGPYAVVSLDLYYLGAGSSIPADQRQNAGFTAAYLLSQFQRPELALTGRFSENPVDTDGNGKFDRLEIGLEVDVLRAGSYQWNAKLTAGNFTEIDFSSDGGSLPAGLSEIGLVYDGRTIGESGFDGPFLVRDLLMFGGGRSLVASDAAVTGAYASADFEGGSSSLSCPAIKVGEPIVQPEDDSGNANFLAAQPISVDRSGTLESLSIYVSSASGDLVLGLYDATGPANGPGAVLAATGTFTAVEGWNTVPVTSPTAIAAGAYWLAFLVESDDLHTPVTRVAPTFNVYVPVAFGGLPAAFPESVAEEPGHWSLYATITPTIESGGADQCGTIALGEPQIQAYDDSYNADYLLAQAAQLDVAARLESLSLYVTSADGSVRMGVYDATGPGGGPGAKLAETAAFVAAGGWNTVEVASPVVLAPGAYWLAYLPSSNDLHNVVVRSGPTLKAYYEVPFGELPATFSADPVYEPGHWSLYATVVPLPH